MAKHTIDTNTSQPVIVSGSGGTWVVTKTASVITAQAFHETALSDAKGARDNTIIVNGAVLGGAAGDDDGIVISGRNSNVVIGKSGNVQGDAGVHMSGQHASVENHGALTASWAGIFADHGGRFVNDGSIDAGVGIWSNAGAATIINGTGGTITSGDTAIILQGNGATSRIINHGTIDAYYYAVDGSTGADIITNRGIMKGAISLKEGNDVFDNRGGTVDQDISSNGGNDTQITDDANVKLSEADGGGRDTVRSTVSYTLNANVENLVLIGKAIGATGNELNNRLEGNNASFNNIQGGAGKDHLQGHGGGDVLSGGADADVFIFSTGDDDDAIVDFEKGLDHIGLRGWDAISNFADVKSHASDIGTDITIHAGKDSIRIQGVDMTDLHAADFLF